MKEIGTTIPENNKMSLEEELGLENFAMDEKKLMEALNDSVNQSSKFNINNINIDDIDNIDIKDDDLNDPELLVNIINYIYYKLIYIYIFFCLLYI